MRIARVTAAELAASAVEFHALLRDAVDHGASVGFTLPLSETEVAEYWRKVGADVAAGTKLLFAARDESQRLLGSGQLALEMRSNGRHRAEVQKLMVFAARRRAGVGATLMQVIEKAARAQGRTLLFLDTSVGSGGAMGLYEQLGYTHCGGIPDYAMDPDGTLHSNAIYYKKLV
jgi:acetyltransferase